MKLLIRGTIFGLVLVFGVSYFLSGQVKQQAAAINYQKQAEAMRIKQEKRSCQQLVRAQMCTKPRDDYARSICSLRLTEFHCHKYMDVEDKIIDADRENNRPS